jgi:cytochrome c-type biogenesis protein CcmH
MKRLLTACALAALSCLAPLAAANEAVPTQRDPVVARREYEIAQQLRCLVCQNQSIAESNAELAVDLRNKVREQIAAGKSDGEIIDYMTARYGDFVLYRPPFKAQTALLWLGPALLLVLGLIIAARVVRARRAPADLTPEQHARAEQLLSGSLSAQAAVGLSTGSSGGASRNAGSNASGNANRNASNNVSGNAATGASGLSAGTAAGKAKGRR